MPSISRRFAPPLGNVRPHPPIARAPGDGTSAGGTRASRILVVEDDYFVAVELEHRLLDAGYDVIGIAATAEDALAKARSGKPDLAVMDIRLASPRDGIEAAKDLATLGIPSIFATAHADPETRRRGEEAHPLGWLHKPYAPESAIALIRQALSKRN